MTNAVRIFALILPLFALALVTANVASQRDHGQAVWQIGIRGYDPRDLLYGHYLTYRYDWNLKHKDKPHLNDTCLCLTSSGNGVKDPYAEPVSCDAPAKQCMSIVKVYPYGDFYALQDSNEPEKYFIPEDKAKDIEDILRKGEHKLRIELMTHTDHTAAIRDLIIDDLSLSDYLRQPKAAVP